MPNNNLGICGRFAAGSGGRSQIHRRKTFSFNAFNAKKFATGSTLLILIPMLRGIAPYKYHSLISYSIYPIPAISRYCKSSLHATPSSGTPSPT